MPDLQESAEYRGPTLSGVTPMLSQSTIKVRTADQFASLIADQMSKMRRWLDNRSINSAGFAPVRLGGDKVAFDAYFTNPEQADLFERHSAREWGMTLTILYRHGDRPDDAKMTMISSQENVETIVDELEQRGFVVEKITVRSASRTPHRDDMPILNGVRRFAGRMRRLGASSSSRRHVVGCRALTMSRGVTSPTAAVGARAKT
jgi:hypothetical protein